MKKKKNEEEIEKKGKEKREKRKKTKASFNGEDGVLESSKRLRRRY